MLVTVVAAAGVVSLGIGLYIGIGDVSQPGTEPVVPATSGPTFPAVTVTVPSEVEDTLTVRDETGTLSIVVPDSWSDTSGGPWSRGTETVGIQVGASPDLDAWRTGWGTPGVFVGVTAELTLDDAFGDWGDSCRDDGEEPLAAAGFVGTIHRWIDCGPEGSTFLEGAAVAGSGELLVYQAVLLGDADAVWSKRVLDTLSYQP